MNPLLTNLTNMLQVCQEGECKSSICVKYNLESCFLTSDVVSDKRQLCELACRKPNNDTCMSTRDLVEQNLIQDLDEGLSLRPGSPCDNFQGYCDVFLKCRKVDAEGPLVRLKNLIFNQENLISIAQWVTVSITRYQHRKMSSHIDEMMNLKLLLGRFWLI